MFVCSMCCDEARKSGSPEVEPIGVSPADEGKSKTSPQASTQPGSPALFPSHSEDARRGPQTRPLPGTTITFREEGGDKMVHFSSKPLGFKFSMVKPMKVTKVEAGGHAENLGVKTDMQIVVIDGIPVAGLPPAEVLEKLKASIAQLPQVDVCRRKVLIVATSVDKFGDLPSGMWSRTLCAPYYIFLDAGFDVTVCSIAGGDVPVDPASLTDPYITDYDRRMIEEDWKPLKGTKKLAEMCPVTFDAYFFPGGYGNMIDFTTDAVGSFVSKSACAGKVVAAVCHGPAAFVKAKGVHRKPLVNGKTIAVFTDVEETQLALVDSVPFSLQAKMTELGAAVVGAAPWSDTSRRDGKLITGQNPQSSVSCANLVIDALNTA